MAKDTVTTNGKNEKSASELVDAMIQLDDRGIKIVRAAANIFQRGGAAAYILRKRIDDIAQEAGLIRVNQELIFREPISDLYDISNGLDFIADKLDDSDQPGAANILRTLGRQVYTIAGHMDDNNWEPRNSVAAAD